MSDDLEKIEELYHQALAKPKAERAAFLAEACAGNDALCHQEAAILDRTKLSFFRMER